MMKRKDRPEGRVLRVKNGYNPNSSSVGSQIPAFFAFAAGAGILTVIALHILNAVGRHIRKRKTRISPLPPGEGQGEGDQNEIVSPSP